MQNFVFPLDGKEIALKSGVFASGILDTGENGEGEATATAGTQTPPPAGNEDDAAEPQDAGLLGFLPIILLYGGLGFAIYFFLFRPQKKREKKMAEMQDSLKVGDNIVTSGGLYGKIVEIGQDSHVVEFGTNRGVRIPIRKSDILGIKAPVLTPPHIKEIPSDK